MKKDQLMNGGEINYDRMLCLQNNFTRFFFEKKDGSEKDNKKEIKVKFKDGTIGSSKQVMKLG